MSGQIHLYFLKREKCLFCLIVSQILHLLHLQVLLFCDQKHFFSDKGTEAQLIEVILLIYIMIHLVLIEHLLNVLGLSLVLDTQGSPK